MTWINLHSYTTARLEKIVQACLQCAKMGIGEAGHDVVGTGVTKFASMKVTSISGDARRVLNTCRLIHSSPFILTGSCEAVSSCRHTVELVHAT